MERTALIVGASGLVGSHLLIRLLDDPRYASVIALTRRPLAVPHPKLVEGIVDFERLDDFQLAHVDDVFCCLGTTIRAAGSKDAFRRVDYEYPLRVARKAHEAGASQLLLISAAGADPDSRVFYSRVKGEIEVAAAALPYRTVVALRPSLLAGERREQRLGERVALALLQPVARLVPAAWRPVAAADVAAAMHAIAARELAGRHVVSNHDIEHIAATLSS